MPSLGQLWGASADSLLIGEGPGRRLVLLGGTSPIRGHSTGDRWPAPTPRRGGPFLALFNLAPICQELTESPWWAGHSDSVGGLAGPGLGSGLALG